MGGRHRLPSRPRFARQLAASTLLIGSVGYVGYLGLTGTDVLYVVPPEPVPDSVPATPPTSTSPPPLAAPPTSSTPRPSSTPPSPTISRPTPPPTTTTRPPAPPKPVIRTPTPKPPLPPPARACPSSGFGGVRPHVARAGHHLANRFGISPLTISGVRLNAIDRNGHPAGRALDVFVTRSRGDVLASYALANRAALGIEYVIWKQRYNDGSGWDLMEDRGSPTANHQTHVHVNFRATSPGPGLPC